MKVFQSIVELQNELFDARKQGKTIGLVPTMGALHDGHASLVKRSVKDNDLTVVSVFVNPTQFNDKNDLQSYPRDLDSDCKLLDSCGADYVFAPSVEEMYPQPDKRHFEFPPVTTVMEGAHRPGHFNGVCQVVSRLFYIVRPQKAYFGADTDKHGIRLDVYAEEAREGDVDTVYDIEPDKSSKGEMRLALPRRTRFYHAKIDADSLASGEDYAQLKNVTVIFISPYDPFGLKRMVYTIKNTCVEEPDMPYEDGMQTLFLYTKGSKGNPPEELRRLLRYLEDSREENALDEDLKEIHRMVQQVKRDREVSLEYMKIFERERMIREEGREEGYASGGEAAKIGIIRRKVEKGFSAPEIAEMLEAEESYVQEVMHLLEENEGASDLEIARRKLGYSDDGAYRFE